MSEERARMLVRHTLELERVPDGTDGIRDVDNPCEMFASGEPESGRCFGDGHYICAECIHLIEWRREEMEVG